METVSRFIVVILLCLLILHALEGNAWQWITSKFSVQVAK